MGSAQQPQRHRRRQAEQQAELDGAVLVGHRRLGLAGAQLARQQRQQGRADGDADHAQRQLGDAVGVVERGDRADRQQRGPHHVEHGADLLHAAADRHRRGELDQPRHPLGPARPHQLHADAVAGAGDQQPQPLQQTRDRHADRGGIAAVGQQGREAEHRADQREVEQDRRGRDMGEAVDAVQHAAIERGERDEQQIGKGDAAELDGHGEGRRVVAHARAPAAPAPAAWRPSAASRTAPAPAAGRHGPGARRPAPRRGHGPAARARTAARRPPRRRPRRTGGGRSSAA